ncbi:MAG: hypothetical protein M1828_006555 [Chrysothrix sp. TS-e1954]|nr:MAG: hypothetical protein M1828_006555 [Chrysothrix sp. TS-e1954]
MAAPHSPPRSPSPPLFGPGRTGYDHIQYSEDFTNTLMRELVKSSSSSKHSGITITTKPGPANASGNAITLAEIDRASLPELSTGVLPLALDDTRRIYNSALPSVRLTHPGGWLEGGSGPHNAEPLIREYMQQLMQQHTFRSQASLQKFIKDETRRQAVELKSRMQDRQEAIEQNEKAVKEIQQLQAQRETEKGVENRMLESAKRRKANK